MASNTKLPDETRQLLVIAARELIGAPFMFGGCSPLAVDCVGLLCLIAEKAPVIFPRTVQYSLQDARRPGIAAIADQHLSPKPSDQLSAGDVVLFWLTKPGLAQHFGVYTGASLIHASRRAPKQVIECPYEGIWKRRAMRSYEFRPWPSSETSST